MYQLFFYHLLFLATLRLAFIFASTDLLKDGILTQFCRRRCHYYDFPIEVIGERKSTIPKRNHVNASVLLNDIHTTTFNINAISVEKSETKVLPITIILMQKMNKKYTAYISAMALQVFLIQRVIQ